MRIRAAVVCASLLAAAGCDREERQSYVIAGPTVPSRVPTAAPYVWDSREELGEWANNSVTRGAVALEGSGADAIIRISPPDDSWVLRGPDLSPIATGVRTARVRYRWRLDPSQPSGGSETISVTMYFDTSTAVLEYMHGQVGTTRSLQPSDQFVDVVFAVGGYLPALDVRYCYLASAIGNRGVLEIDRIELAQ